MDLFIGPTAQCDANHNLRVTKPAFYTIQTLGYIPESFCIPVPTYSAFAPDLQLASNTRMFASSQRLRADWEHRAHVPGRHPGAKTNPNHPPGKTQPIETVWL